MNRLNLCAVGDIVAYHREPERAFVHTADYLARGDVRFAQNERHYSDEVAAPTATVMTERASAAHVPALKAGGFDVISFASNHAMDFGPAYLAETVRHLTDQGFAVIGIGKDAADARAPAIVERNGVRVAFLAYCSVLRPGQDATDTRAGVAPMRAYTHYHQIDYQPGTNPQILSFAHKEDLEAIVADAKAARTKADVVVVSLHWGVHFTPAVIAMYQKEVAHRLIDEGVDAILGHHAHELKAVEIYKGKPIFYSLGNFAFDQPQTVIKEKLKHNETMAKLVPQRNFTLDDPAWPDYCFPPQARLSMIANIEFGDGGIEKVSFYPVKIDGRAVPHVVPPDSPEFAEFVAYMEEISRSQDIDTIYTADGERIAITAGH